MAFMRYSIDGSSYVPGIEEKPVSAISGGAKVGMALSENSDGNLQICGSTTKPLYICVQEQKATPTAGDMLKVVRVLPDTIFETTFSASATSIDRGDKVTIASNGLQVTNTTSSGVAEVVDFPDGVKTSGARVRVRFS